MIGQMTYFLLLGVVRALLMDACARASVRSAAYEFRIMMDGRAESKEQETVYTSTLYISIHLPLM